MSALTLGTPATYRITVQGYLDSSWSDDFGGLVVSNQVAEDGAYFTTLTGWLIDQAAFLACLMGYTVWAFRCYRSSVSKSITPEPVCRQQSLTATKCYLHKEVFQCEKDHSKDKTVASNGGGGTPPPL
jgi:hypothetical protein